MKFAGLLLLSGLLAAVPHASADSAPASGPAFTAQASSLLGIYVAADPPKGFSASADLLDPLPVTPAGSKAQAAARLGPDPKDACQVLGPFRYMARPDVKFEILRDAPNKLVMLFANEYWGHLRTIAIDAEHSELLAKARPLWNGDSVASWKGDTLEIDSVHFTNKTWLNDAGVVNSKQLHLTESLRLVDRGRYLEYHVTAVDPEVLAEPVSYTRYFQRTDSEIQEYDCLAHKPVKPAH